MMQTAGQGLPLLAVSLYVKKNVSQLINTFFFLIKKYSLLYQL